MCCLLDSPVLEVDRGGGGFEGRCIFRRFESYNNHTRSDFDGYGSQQRRTLINLTIQVATSKVAATSMATCNVNDWPDQNAECCQGECNSLGYESPSFQNMFFNRSLLTGSVSSYSFIIGEKPR